MSKRGNAVPRSHKRTEYELTYGNNGAKKGWADMRATARNALVDAWDYLTKHPFERSDRCYPLSGKLAFVTINGTQHERWQYKVTDGGRIWYAVLHSDTCAGVVVLERVSTGHPDETVKNFR